MPYRDETDLEMRLAQSNTFEFVAGLEVGQAIVSNILASDEVLPAGRVYDSIAATSMDSPERRQAITDEPLLKYKLFTERNPNARQAFHIGEMLGIHDQLCRHLGPDYESIEPEVITPPPTSLMDHKRNKRQDKE